MEVRTVSRTLLRVGRRYPLFVGFDDDIGWPITLQPVLSLVSASATAPAVRYRSTVHTSDGPAETFTNVLTFIEPW